MRKIFLASSACFALVGGIALAGPHHSDQTSTNIPIVKNSLAGIGSSSATTGGTAVTAPTDKNAVAANGSSSATSGSTAVTAKLSDVGNDTLAVNKNATASGGSAAAANGSTAITASLTDVGNKDLEVTRTDTHFDVTLSRSSVNGSVQPILTVAPISPNVGAGNYKVETGDASMRYVNGGNGINTAEQNTGLNSLQQNSVSLGSAVGGSGTGIAGF